MSKLRKTCHVCRHGFETSLITNSKRKKPSLDEDKNECGKTNEHKVTSKSSYQISVAVIESDVNVRFTTTSNSLILLCRRKTGR